MAGKKFFRYDTDAHAFDPPEVAATLLTGTTDTNYATLELALAATPTGGTLEVRGTWTRSTTFTVDKSCTVRFSPGASITTTVATIAAITVTASNVTLDRPKLVGTGSATYSTGAGIVAVGTVGAPITGLRISSPNLASFTAYGIRLDFCTDFKIGRVTIDHVTYAGIEMTSCVDGEVDGGIISDVTMTGTTNAYGVSVTRHTVDSGNLTSQPRSENVAVRNLTIKNVPWEGLDTHAGKDISFVNNTIRNCMTGISAVGSVNSAGSNIYAAQGVLVSGNRIYGEVTDGSKGAGIRIVGAGATERVTGVVTGNLVADMGTDVWPSTNDSAGIYLESTTGLVVSGNVLKRPSPFGFNIYNYNYGLILAGNTVEDVWANTAVITDAIIVRETPNTITISGTQIVRGAKTATLVNTEGLRPNADSTQVDAGGNDWTAADTPISSAYSPAVVASIYGTAPVARAAAITTPTSDTVGTKAAIDAIRVALADYGITH